MPLDKAALIEGAIDYIRKNAIVVTSKKGKEYLTVPNFSQAVTGKTIGMLSFAYSALRDHDPAVEGQRATLTAEQALSRMTDVERAAILAKFAAPAKK
jgi:hypothetical protein